MGQLQPSDGVNLSRLIGDRKAPPSTRELSLVMRRAAVSHCERIIIYYIIGTEGNLIRPYLKYVNAWGTPVVREGERIGRERVY